MRGLPPAWPLATPPERRAVELEADPEPTGPIVRLKIDGGELLVLIEPPLPSGAQYPRRFARRDRDFAYGYAKTLWRDNRLGVKDDTEVNGGRYGPYSRTTGQ